MKFKCIQIDSYLWKFQENWKNRGMSARMPNYLILEPQIMQMAPVTNLT